MECGFEIPSQPTITSIQGAQLAVVGMRVSVMDELVLFCSVCCWWIVLGSQAVSDQQDVRLCV